MEVNEFLKQLGQENKCSVCDRKSISLIGETCGMTQPNGKKCKGIFKSTFDIKDLLKNIPNHDKISQASIINSSNAEGCEIISQVYFRKGVSWLLSEIFKDV